MSFGQTEARIKQLDHAARNQLLLETLSPHLSRNEEQKRQFKVKLMNLTKQLIILQLVFVAIPILLIFGDLCLKLPVPVFEKIPVEIVPSIFSFLKYYITAIIAELLAMLFFIVRFVFDKSIVDLVREMIKK